LFSRQASERGSELSHVEAFVRDFAKEILVFFTNNLFVLLVRRAVKTSSIHGSSALANLQVLN
jgi:hypothetical protein